jgi:hypothetical protein
MMETLALVQRAARDGFCLPHRLFGPAPDQRELVAIVEGAGRFPGGDLGMNFRKGHWAPLSERMSRASVLWDVADMPSTPFGPRSLL